MTISSCVQFDPTFKHEVEENKKAILFQTCQKSKQPSGWQSKECLSKLWPWNSTRSFCLSFSICVRNFQKSQRMSLHPLFHHEGERLVMHSKIPPAKLWGIPIGIKAGHYIINFTTRSLGFCLAAWHGEEDSRSIIDETFKKQTSGISLRLYHIHSDWGPQLGSIMLKWIQLLHSRISKL